MKFSIVIPCYNEYNNLKVLLSNIENILRNNNNIEFVIVDNGSTDETYKLTKLHEFDNLKYVILDENLGYGGGIKAGIEYGKTDDFAYNILENPVHVNDLNATVLHCLGIDHERFTHRYLGLDQRLTGVEGSKVVHDILA